jgi:uncharacterized damage-inducible protein DinB
MSTQPSAQLSDQERSIRNELLQYLQGAQAHASFDDAMKNFPASHYAKKPEAAPHNAWQLLEHIRLALHDLLEFCTHSDYQAPKWPEGYWPEKNAPKSSTEWNHSVASVHKDLKEFAALLQDPKTDLTANIPWGEGQTILREILLVGDHTSYHVGQLVLLRIQLGIWKD